MNVAVISDIHANLPALERVMAEIDKSGVDEIWCLGDAVGYGANPSECLAILADRCSVFLVGNHDLGLLRIKDHPYELSHGLVLERGRDRLFVFHGHQASKFFTRHDYLSDFICCLYGVPGVYGRSFCSQFSLSVKAHDQF